MLFINPFIEFSSEPLVLSCFLEEEHESRAINLLLYYPWDCFLVALSSIYLILPVNSWQEWCFHKLHLIYWATHLIICRIDDNDDDYCNSQVCRINQSEWGKSVALKNIYIFLTNINCFLSSLVSERDCKEFSTFKTFSSQSYEWAKRWFLKWETCYTLSDW